jgi:hypothetical protein
VRTLRRTKEFDCVEMMHTGAERVREMTKGMTLDQEVEFWRAETARLREWQRQLREGRQAP